MQDLARTLSERCIDCDKQVGFGCCRLTELPAGRCGRVLGFAGSADVTSRRLFDLGFNSGAKVEFVRKAPLGDPLMFRVGGTEMLLRRAEAKRIVVAVES